MKCYRRLRFRSRRGTMVFEVDILIVPTATWGDMPQAHDPEWQARPLFHLTLAARLTLPPEIARVCDAYGTRRRGSVGSWAD